MPDASALMTAALLKSRKAAEVLDPSATVSALKDEPSQDVMPFGVGGPAEPSASPAGFLTGALKGAFGGVKHLIDASAAAVPGLRREDYTDIPNAPQPNDPMYDAAREMSLNLMGTGMPFAQKGAAGSFGGRLAQTANLDKLKQADRMLDKGQHPDVVRQLTGWEYGPDGKPRFEIGYERDRMMYPNASGPAGALFHAPDTYKAYPQLERLKMFSEVNPNFPSENGMWNLDTGTVELSSTSANQARLGAMHELQHAIQHIEDFTPGSSVQFWQKLLDKHPDFLESHGIGAKDAHDLYHRTYGELEAKNVEARADFDPKMRYLINPRSTEEFPNQKSYALPSLGEDPRYHSLLKALREK